MTNEADTCREFILPKLKKAGWGDDFIREQKTITDGRIVKIGSTIRRLRRKRPDYILYKTADHPIAVVEAKAEYRSPFDGMQQAIEYALMLDLEFAYASNGREVLEHSFIDGKEAHIPEFPSPEELWARVSGSLGELDQQKYLQPFHAVDGKEPRYYQTVAINRSLKTILSGRKRVLITMATGTGKTYVAFQILWRLWNQRWNTTGENRSPKILYLADRNVLVDSPKDRVFVPFKDARWKIQKEANTSREMYFATYQSVAEDESKPGLYKEYPRDFFDLVVVDECHRGSARDDSNWRDILEYFASAVQIGMTATPRREENKDTYLYFGDPVYVYTLAQGIRDGFLAPYEVHRVVADVDAYGWRPALGERDRYGEEIPDRVYTTPDFGRVISHLPRTQAYARRLSDFMREHGRFDKTIVFCEDMEEASIMRQELVNLNADLVREYPEYVVRIVADEGDVGYGHLYNFMDVDSKTPVIVTTSKLLSTGVDVPTCKNIVIFKTVNSLVEFKQIIGRGTRVREDYGKLFFSILDFTGSAVTNFADPDFDGEPARLTTEEIDEHGRIVREAVNRDWDTSSVSDAQIEVTPGREAEHDVRRLRKFYIENGMCEVIGETVYTLDSTGKRVSAAKYTEYVAGQVKSMYTGRAEFRSKWSDWQERREIERLLEENGVDIAHLQQIVGMPDVDPFDVLCHLAYDTPVITRRERVTRVREGNQPFFDKYQEAARSIMNALLDKYLEYGVDEISTMEVFQVPPLNQYGNILEIQRLFGGKNEMLEAITGLQELIYEEK